MATQTKMEKFAEIEALIEQKARQIAEQVYQEKATQFGVATVPIHTHNNVDSPQLEGTAVKTFQTLSAAPGGVISTAILGTQEYSYFGQAYNAPSPIPVLSSPLLIIQGIVGGADSFTGGDAPEGTIILFYTFGTFYQLWARINGEWHGVELDLVV